MMENMEEVKDVTPGVVSSKAFIINAEAFLPERKEVTEEEMTEKIECPGCHIKFAYPLRHILNTGCSKHRISQELINGLKIMEDRKKKLMQRKRRSEKKKKPPPNPDLDMNAYHNAVMLKEEEFEEKDTTETSDTLFEVVKEEAVMIKEEKSEEKDWMFEVEKEEVEHEDHDSSNSLMFAVKEEDDEDADEDSRG